MEFREKVSLTSFTTLGLGGEADYFCEAKKAEEVREALRFAEEKKIPILVLGGGSNVVISDAGFRGLVMKISLRGIGEEDLEDRVHITVGAGESWDDLVYWSVERGYQGLENLSGIPGTVGGAPVQNIGAYGASASDHILGVRALDQASGAEIMFSAEECGFGYRRSIFNSTSKDKYVITHVTFGLRKNTSPEISSYPDLARYFIDTPYPTLKEVREAVLEIRAAKGMVISPKFESFQSVGSFFKNPVISPEDFEGLRARLEQITPPCRSPWYWELPEGQIKISAACLIEQAGFKKGFEEGAVGISPKHTLALIHRGGGTSAELLAFAAKIRQKVKGAFGVNLELEPEVV